MRMRVLIVNVPRMLSDMLKELVHQEEGVEIVGEQFGTVRLPEQLDSAVAQTNPEVLVLGCEKGPRTCVEERLLMSYPQLRIVAIAPEGRTAMIYRQRTEKVEIDEVSPGVLLHAVKGYIYAVG